MLDVSDEQVSSFPVIRFFVFHIEKEVHEKKELETASPYRAQDDKMFYPEEFGGGLNVRFKDKRGEDEKDDHYRDEDVMKPLLDLGYLEPFQIVKELGGFLLKGFPFTALRMVDEGDPVFVDLFVECLEQFPFHGCPPNLSALTATNMESLLSEASS